MRPVLPSRPAKKPRTRRPGADARLELTLELPRGTEELSEQEDTEAATDRDRGVAVVDFYL